MKFVQSLLAAFAAAQDWQDTSAKTTVYSHNLKVNNSGKFKIVQLGDLMNNGSNHEQTSRIVSDILVNSKPDLIVITGDTVDPRQNGNYKTLYAAAMTEIVNSQIPWIWTGGSEVQGLSRDQVLGIDQELNFQRSWSGYKWDAYNDDAKYSEEDLGYFTSRIPILDKDGK
jgi:hypothetical protein